MVLVFCRNTHLPQPGGLTLDVTLVFKLSVRGGIRRGNLLILMRFDRLWLSYRARES
jgi:hypothetical protein